MFETEIVRNCYEVVWVRRSCCF